MRATGIDFDPYANDPWRWGPSMVHHCELLLSCLDVAGARSVLEVGAYAGDLTAVLVAWARRSDATVTAIDPSPQEQLVRLAREEVLLTLVREPSLDALGHVAVPDALIVDGDHNYYTVREELRLTAERAGAGRLPLLLFHDLCWPHGRRDDYFDPERIPPEYRQPLVPEGEGIFPGEPGSRPGGLPYPRSAAREGGPRNGVLTAVEEFVAQREGLRLAVVPAFFGFGVAWQLDAPWAAALAERLAPYDANPMLERLEDNRLRHLAEAHALRSRLWSAQDRLRRQQALLERMLQSSAVSFAERLSRLRVRAGVAPGQSVISKEEIRRALSASEPRGER